MPDFHNLGKQVLHGDAHFCDAATPEAAAQIVVGMNARPSIAQYLDNQAAMRGRGPGRVLRVMASNVRAGLDLQDEGED